MGHCLLFGYLPVMGSSWFQHFSAVLANARSSISSVSILVLVLSIPSEGSAPYPHLQGSPQINQVAISVVQHSLCDTCMWWPSFIPMLLWWLMVLPLLPAPNPRFLNFDHNFKLSSPSLRDINCLLWIMFSELFHCFLFVLWALLSFLMSILC